MPIRSHLKCLNWNIQKSPDKYSTLLSFAPAYDIIFIQENQKLNDSPINNPRHWKRFVPSVSSIRSIIMVKTPIVQRFGLTQVFPPQFHSCAGDVTVLLSSSLKCFLINIYNARNHLLSTPLINF